MLEQSYIHDALKEKDLCSFIEKHFSNTAWSHGNTLYMLMAKFYGVELVASSIEEKTVVTQIDTHCFSRIPRTPNVIAITHYNSGVHYHAVIRHNNRVIRLDPYGTKSNFRETPVDIWAKKHNYEISHNNNVNVQGNNGWACGDITVLFSIIGIKLLREDKSTTGDEIARQARNIIQKIDGEKFLNLRKILYALYYIYENQATKTFSKAEITKAVGGSNNYNVFAELDEIINENWSIYQKFMNDERTQNSIRQIEKKAAKRDRGMKFLDVSSDEEEPEQKQKNSDSRKEFISVDSDEEESEEELKDWKPQTFVQKPMVFLDVDSEEDILKNETINLINKYLAGAKKEGSICESLEKIKEYLNKEYPDKLTKHLKNLESLAGLKISDDIKEIIENTKELSVHYAKVFKKDIIGLIDQYLEANEKSKSKRAKKEDTICTSLARIKKYLKEGHHDKLIKHFDELKSLVGSVISDDIRKIIETTKYYLQTREGLFQLHINNLRVDPRAAISSLGKAAMLGHKDSLRILESISCQLPYKEFANEFSRLFFLLGKEEVNPERASHFYERAAFLGNQEAFHKLSEKKAEEVNYKIAFVSLIKPLDDIIENAKAKLNGWRPSLFSSNQAIIHTYYIKLINITNELSNCIKQFLKEDSATFKLDQYTREITDIGGMKDLIAMLKEDASVPKELKELFKGHIVEATQQQVASSAQVRRVGPLSLGGH